MWQRKNENAKTRGKETHLTLKIDSGGTREIAFIIRLLQRRRRLRAHHKERRRSQSQPTEAQQARRHRPCKGSTLGKVREGERQQTDGKRQNAERSMPRRVGAKLVELVVVVVEREKREEEERGAQRDVVGHRREMLKSGSSECGK